MPYQTSGLCWGHRFRLWACIDALLVCIVMFIVPPEFVTSYSVPSEDVGCEKSIIPPTRYLVDEGPH